MEPTSTALAPTAHDSTLDAPLPMFSGPAMARAFEAYRELQTALDRSMPDQIMRIGDRAFRKKGYWRAVAVAFNLNVEPVEERREAAGEFDDERENFGYLVTYRATAPNGRSAWGDGSCFAIEKAAKFRCPHPQNGNPNRSEHYPHERCPDFDPAFKWRELPEQATEHNVRSHAHTRAFNRAVSNLCGFGEVSAEEVNEDDRDESPGAPRASAPRPSSAAVISEPQRKRLWAIAGRAGWTEDEVRTVIARHGFEHSDQITRAKYDAVCSELERGPGAHP